MIYEQEKCEIIYRQLSRYNRSIAKYREDALQEIAYSVLVSGEEKEALRMAGRRCSRLLRDFGWTRPGVRERYEAYVKNGNLKFYKL